MVTVLAGSNVPLSPFNRTVAAVAWRRAPVVIDEDLQLGSLRNSAGAADEELPLAVGSERPCLAAGGARSDLVVGSLRRLARATDATHTTGFQGDTPILARFLWRVEEGVTPETGCMSAIGCTKPALEEPDALRGEVVALDVTAEYAEPFEEIDLP